MGLQASINRSGAGEVARAVIGALPGECPAARLHGHIVSAIASHYHGGVRLNRQDAVILEQYQRFAHRLACDGAMTKRANRLVGIGTLVRRGFVEHAHTHLDTQDPPHGIIEARFRNRAIIHFAHEIGVERFPVLRRVEDVEPRLESLGAIGIGAARNLAMRVPVTHDEAVKSHLALQHVCHQRLVGMHLHTVPRIVGCHD